MQNVDSAILDQEIKAIEQDIENFRRSRERREDP